MRILVTGASGFLGRAIVAAGSDAGHHMIAVSRAGTQVPGAADVQACGDLTQGIGGITLTGVDAVINCAARVHVTQSGEAAADAAIAMNTTMPLNLAKAARAAGAGRFVQISSVAAVASRTLPGVTFTDATEPFPSTLYGRTKRSADGLLEGLVEDESFSVISIRPPAIYGPEVPAHFAKLMRAAKAGVPLPVGAIRNARSFAYVGNIADAALVAAEASPELLQSGPFIVTDSLPISTAELYSKLLAAAGHTDRVWSWPEPLVRIPSRIALGDRADSLLGSAAFDGSRFAKMTGWRPRVDMDEALRLTLEAG